MTQERAVQLATELLDASPVKCEGKIREQLAMWMAGGLLSVETFTRNETAMACWRICVDDGTLEGQLIAIKIARELSLV